MIHIVSKELIKEIEDMEPIKASDSKEIIKSKLQNQKDVLTKLYTTDAFQNEMARLGFGQPNLAEGATYPLTRMSWNQNLFNSLYRGNWIARKIIDVFPSDMLKNWIKIISEVEPENLRKFNSVIRKTKTKEKIKEGLKWGRLYGGAVGLILIDSEEDLSLPLDYDYIMPDSYKGILVFDRWNGVYPSVEMIDDINDPEFGLPKYYDISLSTKTTAYDLKDAENLSRVHHSRIIRFTGRELPYYEKQAETYWGESELEVVFEELKKRDNTSSNIASLIFLANIRVLKMNDLGQLLGAGTRNAQKNLYNVLEAQNHIMSNMGIYVMDKDDDFATEQYSFSGLNDIYESFMLDVAGACEMPVTKLFGRNPAGFNATGEGDLTQYYETVEEKQETFLQPVLDKLLPIIFMSTMGSVPEDLDWEFNPCMSVSSKDLADLAQSMASPVFDAFNAGLINKSVALRELKQQSDKTGMWSNITDEVISQAEKEEEFEMSEQDQNDIQNEISLENNNENLEGDEQQETENNVMFQDSKPNWKERFNKILKLNRRVN